MRQIYFAAPLALGLAAALPFMPPMVPPAHAQIALVISIPPPILPVYDQPPLPAPGYIWAPGYWAWADGGYYWVPGTWVLPPAEGLLWTPGYWGWNEGAYVWNAGYWGPEVGFYGGVNYGFGYAGEGYQGGYWHGNDFFYNRNVNNFGGVHVTNIYERNVVENITVNRISYNGGQGGIMRQPTPQEMQYRQERRFGPSAPQLQQEHMAQGNRALWASENHGRPPIAATPRPADFSGHEVIPARNAPEAIPHAPGGAMPSQRADQGMGGQHPGQPMNAPRPEQAAPQHMPQVVEPERNNRPEAQPAYHPQQMPVQHEPQIQAPEQRAPQPAYHPEQMQRPEQMPEQRAPQPAFHPEQMQAPRPEQMQRPAEHAPQPERPQEHGGNQDHRPQ